MGTEGVTDGISDGIITMCPKSCLTPHSNPDRKKKHRAKSNYVLNFPFFLTFPSLFAATSLSVYLSQSSLCSRFSESKLKSVLNFMMHSFTILCTQVHLISEAKEKSEQTTQTYINNEQWNKVICISN